MNRDLDFTAILAKIRWLSDEDDAGLINSIHLYALATSSNYSAEDTAALTEVSIHTSAALGSPVYES